MKKIIIVLVAVFACHTAIAQEKKTTMRYIKVVGHAEENFEPEYVDVHISLSDRDRVNSGNDVMRKEEDLLKFLKANGIDEKKLRVQQIGTGEVYSLFGSRYQINKQYTLRIDDLSRYESIILGLVEHGFKNLYLGEIGINDREKKAETVLATAVKNGSTKANIMAGAANVKSIKLYSIDETMDSGPIPMYDKRVAFAAADASNIPLGKINIQKDLTMVFEIE